MQISFSSDNYDIVAHGQTYLFGKDKDLTMDIEAADDFAFSIVLRFSEDSSGERKIERKITENRLELLCVNFKKNGTGLISPVKVAEIESKGLYLLFWSYLEGKKDQEVRSVRYTIFYER